MVDLRPLIVITGTLRVEGGERTKTASKVSGNGHKVEQVTVRNVTTDRRAANVIATNYIRRLRKLIILRTPYGALADKSNFEALNTMLNAASVDVARFNETKRNCSITNTLVMERLEKNRLNAVVGWVVANADDLRTRGLWDRLVEARAA